MAKAALAQETLFALRQTIARMEGENIPALAASARDPARGGFRQERTRPAAGSEPDINPAPAKTQLSIDGAGLDEALGGGLRLDGLNEIRSCQTRDNGAASGFVLALALLAQKKAALEAGHRPRILWIADRLATLETGIPHARGLAGFGLDPESILHAAPKRLEDALMIAEMALSVTSFAAVILEIHGNPARFGLTESRRLHLRARAWRRPIFILRERGEEEASSAIARFAVQPAPSLPRRLVDGRPFEASLGNPVFRVIVEKSRIPSLAEFLLEWNPHDRVFCTTRPDACLHGAPRVHASGPHASGPTLPGPTLPGMTGSQRILSVFLPHLATDRIARARWGQSWRSRGRPDQPPLVCSLRIRNAMRLAALDEAAEQAGLRRGIGVAEARAMLPDLDVIEADPVADQAFLQGIASWCDRYTPLVGIDGCDTLTLDITGCAHFFGGEKALLDDILLRLFNLGLDARAAISQAPGLSWALSHHSRGMIVTPDGAREALTGLPVSALRLDQPIVEALMKAGLRQVGDLFDMPRAPLARRFGPQLLMRLDQALGLEEEPVSPRQPVASLSAERRLGEPVVSEEDILALVGQLAESLRDSMERREQGGKLFELMLFRVDGRVGRISAGASSPLRDPKRIAALFAARLAALQDDLDAGFGFETIRLCVVQAGRLQAGAVGFFRRQQRRYRPSRLYRPDECPLRDRFVDHSPPASKPCAGARIAA